MCLVYLGGLLVKRCLFFAGLSLAVVANAQTVGTVPNGFESTAGNGTFLFMVTTPRTYQYLIQASQLTSFVGQNLNGLQWRLPGSATASWPSVNANFANFDIYIGPGVEPAARSLTFAANYTSAPTLVRSGALTLNAGSFGATGTPRPWGPTVGFSDYLYTGGHLTVEMRHSGMTGNTTTQSFEANTATAAGYGTLYSALWVGNNNPTTGGQANFFITQFSATPVPEPGTVALLGGGLALLLRRRRRT
jgi:hypothetical protein